MKDGEKLNLTVLELKKALNFFGYDVKKDGIRQFIVDAINKIEITYNPRWDVEF